MRILVYVLGLAVVAGCAHYKAQPISPAATAERFESRRLDGLDLKKFLEQHSGHNFSAWPPKSWDLQALTLAAFYFHPSIEVARAQWLVALAGVTTAGARLNPSITVIPGYDSQIPGNYSPWFVPITLDVPIETAGKREKRIAEARKNAEAARWNYVCAAWQLRGAVRSGLLDFKMSGRRAGLLQEQLTMQRQIIKLLQQRVAAGQVSQPEVTIAQIALNRTQLDLGDARSKEVEARSRLAEALGLSAAALNGEDLQFDFSTPEASQLTTTTAREVALRSRADVLGALADYAATDADLRLQIAKQYPDLHLGPAYAWNYGNAGDSQWNLGLTLELPVLDHNQGPIAEAEARRNLAAAKFTQLQAQIISEIDRAVSGFRVAREQMQAGGEIFADEQKQLKSAEIQLKAGTADPLDLWAAHLSVSNAALTQLDNEAKLQVAFGGLEDAIQRPGDAIASAIASICAENRSSLSK